MNDNNAKYLLTRMNRWTAVALVTIFVAGMFFAWWTVLRADRQMREDLLLQARLVERAVYSHRVKALVGSEADLGKSDYQQLKAQLSNIRKANDKCRFLYLMGRKNDGMVFFYVDSEPTTSKGYSPPGQLYEEASKDLRQVFDTSSAVVEGPISDRWGTWITALVPVTDPDTGQLIAVLGMDIDARTWKRDVAVHAILPVGLMLALMILLASWLIATRSRAELHETEEKFRVLADSTPTAVLLYQDDRYIYSNKAAETISGYSAKELSNIHFWDLVHPDWRALIQERGRKRQRGEETTNRYEFKIITKDGMEKWVDLAGASTMIGGHPAGIISIVDITERKQAEMELLREKLFTEKLLESLPGIFFLYDSTCHLKRWNKAHETATGFSADELYDWYIPDWHRTPEDAAMGMALVKSVLETGVGGAFETTLINKEGHFVPYVISISRLLTPDGPAMMGVGIDITERKRAEDALKESENKYRLLADNVNDVIFVLDMNFDITYVSPSIKIFMGYEQEELLKKPAIETMTPSSWDLAMKTISEVIEPKRFEHSEIPTSRTAQLEMRRKDGTTVWAEVMASFIRDENQRIVRILGVTRDITERKRAEEERQSLQERLQRAEKMEALGQLAGGVAHDLNNVLGVLTGYSELLADQLPMDSPLKKHADSILKSSIRGAAIIQDLLTLARRGVTVSEVVDLNRIVYDYLKTPEFKNMKSYHPQIKVLTKLEDGLLNIKGSPIHLAKTVMNLVSNAAEAISGRGEVTIRTENCYLDTPIRGYDEMKEGDYAVLKVSDTGSGISADDLGKIFEPFYTKKVMGRSGTGLGLAVVWGTVKDHHGYIDVQSTEGKGSTFTLYFPVTREDLAKVEKALSPVVYMGKGESILVVDDIKEQRELAVSMLGRLGYQVEAVASGEEAIEYLKDKKADLIILDMIMDPGIDGMETYQRIIKMNPEQKALIVSGFSETERVRKAQELGAGAFVLKPYILEKIGLAVRKELDGK
jgi:two-component system, cell cycle sensor histidine kinase and response regulator CckA